VLGGSVAWRHPHCPLFLRISMFSNVRTPSAFNDLDPIFQKISTAGAVVAGASTICGLLGRNRFARALWLRAFFRYPARRHSSARLSEVGELTFALKALESYEERFVILYGPKGVGKTTALATAVGKRGGVLRLDVGPGMDADKIITAVNVKLWPWAAITKHISVAAKGVIWAYRLLCGPPLVVLDLAQIKAFDPLAAVGAARILSRNGMQVIIDVSEGTLQPVPATFSRARRLYVDYMKWDDVSKFPQLKNLFETLERFGLTSIAKELIGGCPGLLEELAIFIVKDGPPEETKEKIIQFLKQIVSEAIQQRNELETEVPPVREILKLYMTQDSVPLDAFVGIKLEPLARVFRAKEDTYVPRTPVLSYVLRRNLRNCPSFQSIGTVHASS
jgi:hypothetical protein